jgi:polyisoprenoid-binding protein YceI
VNHCGALRALGLAFGLLAAGAASGATEWQADLGQSRLEFTGTLAGGTFDGRFTRFEPRIVFDADDLAGSRFEVLVDTSSADTADAERDAALKGQEFFAAERWPQARFEASRFTVAGPGRYRAAGRLTLRDVTRDVVLEFRYAPAADGRTATLQGETTLRRLLFGVGQGEWRDTEWLADEVRVRFSLMLQRK